MGGTGGSEHLQGSTCQVPRAYLTLYLVVTVAVCSATKQLTRAVPEHDHVSKQRVGSDYNFLPQISTGAPGWSRFC